VPITMVPLRLTVPSAPLAIPPPPPDAELPSTLLMLRSRRRGRDTDIPIADAPAVAQVAEVSAGAESIHVRGGHGHRAVVEDPTTYAAGSDVGVHVAVGDSGQATVGNAAGSRAADTAVATLWSTLLLVTTSVLLAPGAPPFPLPLAMPPPLARCCR